MKLFEVPDGSIIKILEDAIIPPGSLDVKRGDVLKFSRIDGMYSSCFKDGERVYPAAYTEVEILSRENK